MGTGTLEIFFISADISPHAHPNADNVEIYVVLRYNKEQKFTQIVGDHGRRPVWNEMLKFGIQQQDSSKDFLIDLYARSSPVDEFLGSTSIPVADMLGKDVTQTCTLISPSNVEIGKLRIDWKWKPVSQDMYSKLDAVSEALTQISVSKTSSTPTSSPYHIEPTARTEEVRTVSRGYDQHSSGYPPAQYPPSDDRPPPGYPPSAEQPPYGYPPSQYPPSSEATEIGDTKEKGHSSGYPYQYPPPGGYYSSSSHGYPPASHGYPPSSHGYPPASHGYSPSPYGYPPASHGYPPAAHGYPPAQHGYPPAPHGYPPAPHGYPPAPHGYPSAPHGYAPHGGHYGGHHGKHKKASYKIGHHGGYMGYPGYHSSKHSKKHKMPKHGWSHHHKHKKYKFGKGFKGFKMKKMMKFKKFKF